MSFEFTEDTIRQGSAPFTSGLHDFIIEAFYFAERTKKDGSKWLNLNIGLVEAETSRKLNFTGFDAIYGGSIDDNGTWNLKTKDGKKDQRSVETLNSFLLLAGLPTYAGSDFQTKIAYEKTKQKEYNTEVDALTIKELIGRPITIGIKMEEDGYEKDGLWVEQTKPRLEAIFDTATRKTAFEKATNKPAKFHEDFAKSFPEDYVSEIWGDKKALKDKLQAFSGADTSTDGADTDSTTATAPSTTTDDIADAL